MITLTILLIIILSVLVVALLTIGVGGIALAITFGDVIIAALVIAAIVTIIKKIRNKKKGS